MIGKESSGQTSLINNLLGEEIAKEDDDTPAISTFKGMLHGVSVTVYEASNLSVEYACGSNRCILCCRWCRRWNVRCNSRRALL